MLPFPGARPGFSAEHSGHRSKAEPHWWYLLSSMGLTLLGMLVSSKSQTSALPRLLQTWQQSNRPSLNWEMAPLLCNRGNAKSKKKKRKKITDWKLKRIKPNTKKVKLLKPVWQRWFGFATGQMSKKETALSPIRRWHKRSDVEADSR